MSMSFATRPPKLSQGSEQTFESALSKTLKIIVFTRILLDGLSAKFIFVDLITILIIAWLVVQEIALKNKSRNLSAKRTFVPFYIFLLVSSVYAYAQEGIGIPLLFFQAKFLMLILLSRFVFRMSSTERIRFRDGLILVLTISAAIGLTELILGRSILTQNLQIIRVDRFSGFILWPNMASILFGIALCGVVVSSRKTSVKVVFSLILFGGILATGTLTGSAATILGLFWILRKKYALFLLFLSIGYFSFRYAGFSFGIVQRVSSLSIPNFESLQYQRSTDSASWRLIQWQRGLSVLRENFYFGVGLGGAQYTEKLGGFLPHSDYLRIILETGITGLIFFFTALKSAIMKLFPKEMQVKSPLTLACLSIVAISSATENLLGQTVIYLIVPFFIINTEKGV